MRVAPVSARGSGLGFCGILWSGVPRSGLLCCCLVSSGVLGSRLPTQTQTEAGRSRWVPVGWQVGPGWLAGWSRLVDWLVPVV